MKQSIQILISLSAKVNNIEELAKENCIHCSTPMYSKIIQLQDDILELILKTYVKP